MRVDDLGAGQGVGGRIDAGGTGGSGIGLNGGGLE